MFSSVPRIAGLLAATSMALASLATPAHAQTGAQGRPDATNVQMVSVPETYCRSIDNTDMTGQDYYFSAADVTAKSGKVIQSHNGGSCCTAAAPWNGSACQAVPTCTNDKDLVGWTCVATATSCARVGMSLINGACGVASPSAWTVQDLFWQMRGKTWWGPIQGSFTELRWRVIFASDGSSADVALMENRSPWVVHLSYMTPRLQGVHRATIYPTSPTFTTINLYATIVSIKFSTNSVEFSTPGVWDGAGIGYGEYAYAFHYKLTNSQFFNNTIPSPWSSTLLYMMPGA